MWWTAVPKREWPEDLLFEEIASVVCGRLWRCRPEIVLLARDMDRARCAALDNCLLTDDDVQ